MLDTPSFSFFTSCTNLGFHYYILSENQLIKFVVQLPFLSDSSKNVANILIKFAWCQGKIHKRAIFRLNSCPLALVHIIYPEVSKNFASLIVFLATLAPDYFLIAFIVYICYVCLSTKYQKKTIRNSNHTMSWSSNWPFQTFSRLVHKFKLPSVLINQYLKYFIEIFLRLVNTLTAKHKHPVTTFNEPCIYPLL